MDISYKCVLNPAVKIYAPICLKGRNSQQQQTQVVRAVGARPYCSMTFLIEIFRFFLPPKWTEWPTTRRLPCEYFFTDKFRQVRRGAPCFSTPARISVYFTELPWLIATFIIFFFPLSNLCLQSGWTCFLNNQEHLEWKCCLAEVCQRFFPSLCCGYFKKLCKLGYKSD